MQNKFNFDLDQDNASPEPTLGVKIDLNQPSNSLHIIKDDSPMDGNFPCYVDLADKLLRSFQEPSPGFVVIVDSSGNVVDHLSKNCNPEEVNELVLYLDEYFENAAPHSAWACNGSFERLA